MRTHTMLVALVVALSACGSESKQDCLDSCCLEQPHTSEQECANRARNGNAFPVCEQECLAN